MAEATAIPAVGGGGSNSEWNPTIPDVEPQAGSNDTGDDYVEPGTETQGKEGVEAKVGEEEGKETPSGRELYQQVKEHFKDLDPKLMRAVKDSIWKAENAEKQVQEKVEAATQAYKGLESLADEGDPPEVTIEKVAKEVDGWRGFEDQFSKADPQVVYDLAESYPEAMQVLTPQVLTAFSKLNPEGYSALISQPVQKYFDDGGIALQFQMLNSFWPSLEAADFQGKESVLKAIQHIYALHDNLAKMAAGKVGYVKYSQGDQNQGGTNPADREGQLNAKEWNIDVRPDNNKVIDDSIASVAKSAKTTLTPQESADVRRLAIEEVLSRIGTNNEYAKAMRSYAIAGNKTEYLRRSKSEHAKYIPTAVRHAINDVLDRRGSKGATPAAKGAPQKGAPQKGTTGGSNGTARKDESGREFVWLPKSPGALGKEVDFNRTTSAMYRKGEAYFKGDKRLYKWNVKSSAKQ